MNEQQVKLYQLIQDKIRDGYKSKWPNAVNLIWWFFSLIAFTQSLLKFPKKRRVHEKTFKKNINNSIELIKPFILRAPYCFSEPYNETFPQWSFVHGLEIAVIRCFFGCSILSSTLTHSYGSVLIFSHLVNQSPWSECCSYQWMSFRFGSRNLWLFQCRP